MPYYLLEGYSPDLEVLIAHAKALEFVSHSNNHDGWYDWQYSPQGILVMRFNPYKQELFLQSDSDKGPYDTETCRIIIGFTSICRPRSITNCLGAPYDLSKFVS